MMHSRTKALFAASTLTCCLLLSACFTAQAQLVVSNEYSLEGIYGIELNFDNDNISILPSPNDSLVLDEYISNDDPDCQAIVSTGNGVVHIEGGNRDVLGAFESYVELYLPASYEGSLTITTRSGQVTLGIENTLGNVIINSISGALTISNIDAQTIVLTNETGRIRATSCSAVFDCSSLSGSITATGLTGCGSFSSDSGACQLEVLEMTGDITASTISGRLSLALPQDQPMRFVARSISGHITVPFEEEPPTALTTGFVAQGIQEAQDQGETLAAADFKTLESNQGMNPPGTIRLATTSGRIAVTYL